jgi:kynurenine formamidase
MKMDFQWIDLTHELCESIPTWDGHCGFHHTNLTNYDEITTECNFLIQRVEMLAGVGTHIDAPAHCFPKGKTIDEIPLESLISPCVVIDVSKKAHEMYSVAMQDIEQFENAFGVISKGVFVIFFTGWDRFWNQPDKYHNHHRFPSISREVAEYLVAKDVVGLGIDTLSPDRPESGFPVHQAVLGANKYIVENIANAHLMPVVGGCALVLPMKIKGATEAPIRLLGMVSKMKQE